MVEKKVHHSEHRFPKMKMNILTGWLDASTCFFMNADVSDGSSLFANHLMQFCSDNGLNFSSKLHLPDNSYTYISEAWHTASCLDHCICTADAHDT